MPADDLPSRLSRAWSPADWRDTHTAVAVSGGADSVALLRALAEIKRSSGGRGELNVLHFDHGLRGTASTGDARWVSDLASELGLPCSVGHAKRLDSASEESLRDARREFYKTSANALGVRYLATGHTADDQAETVLFRILRGSGLRGLSGIPRFARLTEGCTLVRPLLDLTRQEVADYLAALGQAHREDESNRDLAYARNWIRGEALPKLRDRFPQATRQLIRLAKQADETRGLVEHAAERLLSAALLSPIAVGEVRLSLETLSSEPEPLVREALRLAWREAGWPEQSMDADSWCRLAELAFASAPACRQDFPGGVAASTEGGRLVLASAR